ncbi:DUF1206 domain-containing protein [Corynebacterium hylobatis]|uniref:DUF1206 domain-containing protein n=1 Tax=Corynebacterium hylobatis TaxID=1859290 RepID=A0A3S0BFY3_9CORY|nr:DUF1206 domain-containing protein [Corynebacterium hylobatis]RSZ62882.1 DUF1206 domain-containing protein [Corynebacterium hylobatis]
MAKVADHPALTLLARGGYIVLGLVHILIGWIAVQIATGSGGGEASNTGALATIAQAPGGQFLLWAAVLCLAALALWRASQLFTGEDLKDRAKGGILAVVYLSLAFTTATFARGGSTSDSETATDVTATALAQPWGEIAVMIAGAVVVAVGLYNIWRGATKGFREDLEAGAGSGQVGSAIIIAGMVGYIARGIAFAVLGGLIFWAGWANDPEQAAGLDAALRTLGEQPAGSVLLIVIGVGLALYGLYSIARARYVRM